MSDFESDILKAGLQLMGAIRAASDQAQSMTDDELGECLLTGRGTTIEIHEAGRRLLKQAAEPGEVTATAKGTGSRA